jgi:transposase-like protein
MCAMQSLQTGNKGSGADLSVSAEDKTPLERERFTEKWRHKYPQIINLWHSNGHNLTTIFSYLKDILKVIYTIKAIESLNIVIHQSVKTRNVFPSDDAAL